MRRTAQLLRSLPSRAALSAEVHRKGFKLFWRWRSDTDLRPKGGPNEMIRSTTTSECGTKSVFLMVFCGRTPKRLLLGVAAGVEWALNSPVMPQPSWNEHTMASGELSWDTGRPEPVLVEFVTSGGIAPGWTLEIGAGTGTNAIWLAKRGVRFDSRLAIPDRAIARYRDPVRMRSVAPWRWPFAAGSKVAQVPACVVGVVDRPIRPQGESPRSRIRVRQ
jgi:hypothetical protein